MDEQKVVCTHFCCSIGQVYVVTVVLKTAYSYVPVNSRALERSAKVARKLPFILLSEVPIDFFADGNGWHLVESGV